jgi:elongation factor P
MVPITQMKAGKTFRLDNEPYIVIDYKHTKMGRGNASIRLKVRNLKNGDIVVKTFISGAKVEPLETELRTLQYLWHDADNYYFMHPTTFEQSSLPARLVGENGNYLQPEKTVKVLFIEDEPLSIEIPISMVFTVAQTPPGVRGDTVSGSNKPAVLDNGLKVRVPLFVKVGDKVKIDTRSGSYVERVSD